jgi:hypothetical protein
MIQQSVYFVKILTNNGIKRILSPFPRLRKGAEHIVTRVRTYYRRNAAVDSRSISFRFEEGCELYLRLFQHKVETGLLA